MGKCSQIFHIKKLKTPHHPQKGKLYFEHHINTLKNNIQINK
jgi:hypothetical protein